MRICIDGRMYNESGIGRYIRNLLVQLQEIDKKNEYCVLHLEKDFSGLNYQKNFQKISADFRWYKISEQIRLLRLLRELKPDLVHFPHFNAPVLYKDKFVVTIHDLIHQHFSMERSTTHGYIVYKLKQFGYRKVFNHAVKTAKEILVPSDFVKNQLVGEWEINSGKVVVTHEAVDGRILDLMASGKWQAVSLREKFGIHKPYIFYVGNAHPHKNVEGLISVFGELREKYPALSLVLSGNDHYFWQRIRKEFQQEGIIYTGKVSDEELVGLYKNALIFVMPSFEEGFGIPVLEAFACGCPVVSSSAGSLSEVGGIAALYFDPRDRGDMVNRIDTVLKSKKVRKELIEKGLKRCGQFSWKKLAQKTLEVYSQCV